MFPWYTSHFMTTNCLRLQEAPFSQRGYDRFSQENAFGATNAPPVGCEWHHNITLIINSSVRLSVLNLTFANSPSFRRAVFFELGRGTLWCLDPREAWLWVGKWADLCGTAMQSQLLMEPEQAPDIPSPCKNKFNIEEDTWSSYQILSW